jgi:hypothetical protein
VKFSNDFLNVSVNRPQIKELADEDQEDFWYGKECLEEKDESQCRVSSIKKLTIAYRARIISWRLLSMRFFEKQASISKHHW